jgi:enoyl-CoA hydratase
MSANRRNFIKALAAVGAAAGAAGIGMQAAQSETAGYQKYSTLKVDVRGPVAYLLVYNVESLPKPGERPPDAHWELSQVFADLRSDNDVRVVVMTGPGNGIFHAGKRNRYGSNPAPRDQENEWLNFTGVRRMHEEMAQSEKIIIAKVNGDAIGFGQSLVFAADLIVAQENAIIADFHLAMGEIGDYGPEFGVVPGDGGCALAPLFMTPVLAKEYLLLGKQYTASELARLGIINYAVPAAKLDATVDDIVARLLKRPAYALAWGKRVANKRVVNHLNQTLDAAAAYEQLNMLQLEKRGWKDKKSFL